VGFEECEGHRYECAVSAAWKAEKQLAILVQILDAYFGVLYIYIGFNDTHAVIRMEKNAEMFLEEYNGYANAVMEPQNRAER